MTIFYQSLGYTLNIALLAFFSGSTLWRHFHSHSHMLCFSVIIYINKCLTHKQTYKVIIWSTLKKSHAYTEDNDDWILKARINENSLQHQTVTIWNLCHVQAKCSFWQAEHGGWYLTRDFGVGSDIEMSEQAEDFSSQIWTLLRNSAIWPLSPSLRLKSAYI